MGKKTIECLSIQNRQILVDLNNYKIHSIKPEDADKYINSPILIQAYDNLRQAYNWTTYPIFLGEIGKYTEMSGARTTDSVILRFEIPEEYIHRQEFYNWSDYLYFLEHPKEFKETFSMSFQEFEKEVLFPTNNLSVVQVTVPYLLPEWLTNAYPLTEDFIDKYINAGGNNRLFKERVF